MENNMNQNTQNREELTIKFAKGLVGQPFTAKTGRECVAIKIPNEDPADKRPWESIVVAANHVHEDKFGGKGVWMKVPADGQTKVSRSELTGTDENGKNVSFGVVVPPAPCSFLIWETTFFWLSSQE